MAQNLITIGDASRRFAVSVDTLRRWAAAGQIRCWRGPGGRRYFNLDELLEQFAPEEPPQDAEEARDAS